MRYYRQLCNVYDRVWAKDAKMVSVYLYLHCCAYVQDGELHGIKIRRGSCLTSRTSIMEATGLSEADVKSRLKLLANYGEIIRNSSNLGTIITVCDYDNYNGSDDLFSLSLSNQSPNELPNELPSQSPTTPINRNNSITVNNNLRSNFIPSKIERESKRAVVEEIRKFYNKMFDGVLPEWKRITDKMVNKVDTCITVFSRQAVDMVFDQLKHESFMRGEGKVNNGFKADAFWIFETDNFDKLLSRYELRLKKKQQQTEQEVQPQQKAGVDSYEIQTPARLPKEDYEREMRKAAANGNAQALRLVAIWDNQQTAKI